jgi:hypothetical protein
MALAGQILGDFNVTGTIFAGAMNVPANAISNAQVIPGANIDGSKVGQENPGATTGYQLFNPTTTVVAITQTLGMALAAGQIMNMKAFMEVQATGGDRTVTVDLQKSTGGGAYATILTSTIVITNATAIRTAVAAVLGAGASYVAGDIFRLVVTVAGVAGAQAQGLTVVVCGKENPQ